MTAFDFSGKVVLVTGGTKGIGAAIARAFLDAGATVYVCGRTPPGEINPEASAVDGGTRSAPRFMAADVRDIEALDALLASIEHEAGQLDVVVNNAGGAPFVLAAQASPRFTESVIRLNLLAPLQLAQRANTLMQKQATGGVLLFIGSVSGLRPSPGTAAYGAAKAGIVSAVRSLAVEWAPKVRVCAVSPSLVQTEAASSGHIGSDSDIDGALAKIAATVPAGRLATPDDIASACLFLASPHASYASGSNLVLEGGGEMPAFLGATDLRHALTTPS